jgi:hypothetical protein
LSILFDYSAGSKQSEKRGRLAKRRAPHPGNTDMPNTERQLADTPPPNQDPLPLFHLGYVSSETQDFSSDALIALLTEARTENAKRDVTGLLLYREGSFYQVLEGRETDVISTFEGIEHDPRHDSVRVLFKGETPAREFADWQMGFLNLDGLDIESLSGFSDFLSRDAQPQEFLENLSRGKKLALMFRSML